MHRHAIKSCAVYCIWTLLILSAAPISAHGVDDDGIVNMTEYSTKASCQAALKDLGIANQCEQVRYNGFETIQAAYIDIEGTGHKDLVLRRFTRQDCSLAGCTTMVYRWSANGLRRAGPVIFAVGAIVQCTENGQRGLNLSHQTDGPCLIFQ